MGVRQNVNYAAVMRCEDISTLPSKKGVLTKAATKRLEDCDIFPTNIAYEGEDALQQYHDGIIKATTNTIHLAHNGTKFDNWLFYAHLRNNGQHPTQASFKGVGDSQVMGMMYLGHVFLDFYNHFASSLADCVKHLGLAKALDEAMIEFSEYGGPIWSDGSLYRDKAGNLGKNFFPYRANNREVDEELGYAPIEFAGPIEKLPLRFWELDDKKPEEREICIQWLAGLKGYHYNVREQLRAYCKLDTLILKKAVEVYRKQMLTLCGHDPFQCLTLPTYVFRTFYMHYYEQEKYPLFKLEADAKALARAALTGGRTDFGRVYYKCQEGETIKTADVASLYPATQYHDPLPYGRPVLHYFGCEGVADEFHQYHPDCSRAWLEEHFTGGFIWCDMLPPLPRSASLSQPFYATKMARGGS